LRKEVDRKQNIFLKSRKNAGAIFQPLFTISNAVSGVFGEATGRSDCLLIARKLPDR